MTTIIGMKTNIGDEAIVLASDTQLNYYDDDDNVIAKRPLLKIIHGDFWALACSGGDTDELRRFYNKLKNPDDKRYTNFGAEKLKEMMLKSINGKRFYEINELNAKYMKEEGDIDSTHEFVMAVNKPNVDIFHIDSFGNLKKPKNRNYIFLGSGKDEAEKYIEECIDGDTFDAYNLNIEDAIRLSTGAIKKSKYDILSGGPMDLVVIERSNISSFGKEIRNSLEKAEKNVLEDIIKRVKNN